MSTFKFFLPSLLLSLSFHSIGMFWFMENANKAFAYQSQNSNIGYAEVNFINSKKFHEAVNAKDDYFEGKSEVYLRRKKIVKNKKISDYANKDSKPDNYETERNDVPRSNSDYSDSENRASWKVVKCPIPAYPKESRKAKQEGQVVIEAVISPKGEIISSSIVFSSGFKSLDEAALTASRQVKLRYRNRKIIPKNCEIVRIPYVFQLK
ncbi:MAG: energy transducer TonB [Elusimicrobiota bacterium]|jgi:TonB family protein|nr:energy transducer TonB [Elusimicrobiota bacterium]